MSTRCDLVVATTIEDYLHAHTVLNSGGDESTVVVLKRHTKLLLRMCEA